MHCHTLSHFSLSRLCPLNTIRTLHSVHSYQYHKILCKCSVSQLILIQKYGQTSPLIYFSSLSLEIGFAAAHMRDCGREADSLPNVVLVPYIAYAVKRQYNGNYPDPVCLLVGVIFGHGRSNIYSGTHLVFQRRVCNPGILPSVRHQKPLLQHLFHPRQKVVVKSIRVDTVDNVRTMYPVSNDRSRLSLYL